MEGFNMSHSRFTFIAKLAMFLAVAAGAHRASSQTGTMLVYNVQDYGAHGTGGDDSGGIQLALAAAINAGGGIVYFPAGTYLIEQPIPTSSPGLPPLDAGDPSLTGVFNLQNITLRGAGVNTTQIKMAYGDDDVSGSITVTAQKINGVNWAYHSGLLEELTVSCTDDTQTGLISVDAIGLKYHNVLFKYCGTALDMQNRDDVVHSPLRGWHERNDLDNVSFYDNLVAVHFDYAVGNNGADSYGYNSYRIYVKTSSSTARVFWDSGGGHPYNNYFDVSGQITPGTEVFDGHYDTAANNFPQDTFLVRLDDLPGTGTSYVFDSTEGSSTFTGMYSAKVGLNTHIFKNASTATYLTDLNATPVDLGIIFPGSGTSQVISDPRITTTSACFVRPENATSASMMSSVYIDGYSPGPPTLHKTSAGGASFHLWCHP
jgi:hypothetical protein